MKLQLSETPKLPPYMETSFQAMVKDIGGPDRIHAQAFKHYLLSKVGGGPVMDILNTVQTVMRPARHGGITHDFFEVPIIKGQVRGETVHVMDIRFSTANTVTPERLGNQHGYEEAFVAMLPVLKIKFGHLVRPLVQIYMSFLEDHGYVLTMIAGTCSGTDKKIFTGVFQDTHKNEVAIFFELE